MYMLFSTLFDYYNSFTQCVKEQIHVLEQFPESTYYPSKVHKVFEQSLCLSFSQILLILETFDFFF